MNRRELEQAIRDEVAEWPGVTVEFAEGGKHPKAKLTFTPEGGEALMLSRPFPGTPSDSRNGLHKTLGDMRRTMRQLGAERPKPEPSEEEVEARYRKPNEGADKREPVAHEKAAVQADLTDKMVATGAATPERAAAARAAIVVEGPGDDEDTEAKRAAIRAQVAAIVDGVYFGLPDYIYHAVPRLSASGLQNLCVSAGTFWRGSWLDPERPEEDEESTKARVLGKAYHTARLEPHLFDALYVRALDKADFPKGTLFTGADMGRALEEMGAKKSGSVTEQAERLADLGYEGPVWQLAVMEWEAARAGRTAIPGKFYDQIVTDMERIRSNADVAALLIDGEAEVSIFWTDEHGLKMKSRVDWLTVGHWADLKSFDNSRGKELTQALADAMRYYRYHVQAVTYRDAVEAIRTGGAQIQGEATDAQRALVAAIQMRPGELACWYVFVEKGGVPNLLAYRFPFHDVPYDARALAESGEEPPAAAGRRTALHKRASLDVGQAKRLFALYSSVYQPGEPWMPIEPTGEFTSDMFSPRWLDGSQ